MKNTIVGAFVFLGMIGIVNASPLISTVASNTTPINGGTITVDITVDMTGRTDLLGAYSFNVTWNSAVLQYTGVTGGTTTGFTAVNINGSSVNTGMLSINQFYTTGASGVVNVARVSFSVVGNPGSTSSIGLVVNSLSAAVTFIDLKSDVETNFTAVTVNSYTGPAIESVVVTPNSGTVGPGQIMNITVTAHDRQTGLTASPATFLGHQVALTSQGNGTYTGTYTITAADYTELFDKNALFTDNFETGALNAWNMHDNLLTLENQGKFGSRSVGYELMPGEYQRLAKDFPTVIPSFATSFYMKISDDIAINAGESIYIGTAFDSSNACWALKLRKYNGNTQVAVYAFAHVALVGDWQTLNPGQWYWIKVRYIGSTTGSIQWSIDGVNRGTYNGNTSIAGLRELNGIYTNAPLNVAGHINWDHFQITADDHRMPMTAEAMNIVLTDTGGHASTPASSSGSTLVIDASMPPQPVIQSVTLLPNSGRRKIGDTVTITATEKNGQTGLTATPVQFNGVSVPLIDQGNGTYRGVYTVVEGNADGINVEATGITLTGAGGTSPAASSTGSTLRIDAHRPQVLSVVLEPNTGYLSAGKSVTIVATAGNLEAGLSASAALINGVTVPLTDMHEGHYIGSYVVQANNAQGVNIQATGIALTDSAGNVSVSASSAVTSIVIDTVAPGIASVTLNPSTGRLAPGDSLLIVVRALNNETGLIASTAAINHRTVTITEAGSGFYTGLYVVGAYDETGVALHAAGITLTDRAGNLSTTASSSGETVMVAPAYLQVLSPNGGETFAEGTVQPIVWDVDYVDSLRIEYTTDGGTQWNLIAAKVSTVSGLYQWTVPGISSASCRIRLTDTSDSTVYDISDNVFSLVKIPVSLRHFAVVVQNTGSNAILLIPGTHTPTINGVSIAIGDEIAVITPRGQCAGAGIWTGGNLAISVWGDDPDETGISGFGAGEDYQYSLWDASADMVFDESATYTQGDGRFAVNGITIIDSLFTQTAADMIIPLQAGWNHISANFMPAFPTMERVFYSVREHLTIVKNGAGEVYWPAFEVNQIGDWSTTEAYQVKMSQADTLEIRGVLANPATVTYQLTAGWNLISYIGSEGLSPAAAFASIQSSVIILKDAMGSVWWPSYGIDQIHTLSQGKGYWIKLNAPVSFKYPSAAAKIVEKDVPQSFRHYRSVEATGNNSTVLFIPDNGNSSLKELLSAGDELAVFDTAGLCVGAGIWNSSNLALAVWGDDQLTQSLDGMKDGGIFEGRLWDNETGLEYSLNLSSVGGPLSFEQNGLTVIQFAAKTVAGEKGAPAVFELLPNFPNPFNPTTTIEYTVPRQAHIRITVFSVSGQQVAILGDSMVQPGRYAVTWNASDLPSGVYFCRLTTGDTMLTTKLLLLK
jgi:hypothetical protein